MKPVNTIGAKKAELLNIQLSDKYSDHYTL
jgi:hypothetical protein